MRPGVGGIEIGEIEQALVYQRYGVGHGAAVGFAHGQLHGLFRAQGFGHAQLGLQARRGVFYPYRHHAVHPDGQVVFGLRVGLQQLHVGVHVGGHGGGGLKPYRIDPRFGVLPVGGQHLATVFYGQQDASHVARGQTQLHGLARGVAFLVGGEGELCRRFAPQVAVVVIPGVAHVDALGSAVAAFGVAHPQQIGPVHRGREAVVGDALGIGTQCFFQYGGIIPVEAVITASFGLIVPPRPAYFIKA